MRFGFALDLSNTDLWNIYLSDAHLHLLDTDIPSKYFVYLHNVFKMSSRCLQDMFSRRLEDVFSVTILRLPRCLQDVLEDEKLLRWRRVEDVFKTCLEDVLKTSWRPTNICRVMILKWSCILAFTHNFKLRINF